MVSYVSHLVAIFEVRLVVVLFQHLNSQRRHAFLLRIASHRSDVIDCSHFQPVLQLVQTFTHSFLHNSGFFVNEERVGCGRFLEKVSDLADAVWVYGVHFSHDGVIRHRLGDALVIPSVYFTDVDEHGRFVGFVSQHDLDRCHGCESRSSAISGD